MSSQLKGTVKCQCKFKGLWIDRMARQIHNGAFKHVSCLRRIIYLDFEFWKLIVFICDISTKVTCAFLASEAMEELSESNTCQT